MIESGDRPDLIVTLRSVQITEMIQTKLVLARGVRSKQDQELMQFGTLKIMLAQQIHAEQELDRVSWRPSRRLQAKATGQTH